MALVCKECGYKQYDEETIEYQKKIFPDLEEHDIPYYCGACMDNASEQERIEMDQEMCGLECPLGGDETDDCSDCPYAGDYHFVNGECVRREDDNYTPSAENGDYSPSNPWDAPGMSISDFI